MSRYNTRSVSIDPSTGQPFHNKFLRIAAKTNNHGYDPNYQAIDTGQILSDLHRQGVLISLGEASHLAKQKREGSLDPGFLPGFNSSVPRPRRSNKPQRGPLVAPHDLITPLVPNAPLNGGTSPLVAPVSVTTPTPLGASPALVAPSPLSAYNLTPKPILPPPGRSPNPAISSIVIPKRK